jgi:hypothetical protein
MAVKPVHSSDTAPLNIGTYQTATRLSMRRVQHNAPTNGFKISTCPPSKWPEVRQP